MASKKKNNSNKKKIIDLTEDKTSTLVKNSNMNVERTFQKLMKESNIPAFIDVAKETTIARYFLNRNLYATLFGKNLAISDYFLRVAISKEVSRLANEIFDGSSNYVYPGYWGTEVNIQSFLHVNLVPNTDDTTKWYVTTIHCPGGISDGQIAELQAAGNYTTVMAFEDYNPNRLFQIINNAYLTTVQVIINEINQKYPKAYASTKDVPTVVRMAKELGLYLHEDVSKMDMDLLKNAPNDKPINEVINIVEKPLMVYMVELIKAAGINESLVEDMMSKLKLHAIFDASKASCVDDVTVTYMVVLPPEDPYKGIQTQFIFQIKDLINIALDDDKSFDRHISMTNLSKYGMAIKRFLNEMISLCAAYAIRMDAKLKDSQDAVDEDVMEESDENPLSDLEGN